MMTAALLCSVGAIICYLLCYHMTTERVKMEKTAEKFSFKELIRTTISNRADRHCSGGAAIAAGTAHTVWYGELYLS